MSAVVYVIGAVLGAYLGRAIFRMAHAFVMTIARRVGAPPRCRAVGGPCRSFIVNGACVSPNGCGPWPLPPPPRFSRSKEP